MSNVFPNWQRCAVLQRHPRTGCIPTGYEMLLRAAGVAGIDYATFQEDFDLDLQHGEALNNFGSVGDAVSQRYPFVSFRQQSFPTGSEKLAFIEEMNARQHPLLISVSTVLLGQPGGWHIMPIVDATATELDLLVIVRSDGSPVVCRVNKETLVHVHDTVPGGKEVAYLELPRSS